MISHRNRLNIIVVYQHHREQECPGDVKVIGKSSVKVSGPQDVERRSRHQIDRSVWVDSSSLLARACGKLNLTLSVGKKRSDGYHAFESLMVTISLYDDIIFRPGNGSIKLSCDDPMVPCDERNLVYRAAKVLADSAGINPSVEIELIKRIPSQAGLGGGSSDAAATLWALNDYWKIGYSVSELTCLAEKLGSDVGFFLHGPVGVCSGRGEIIDPVDVRFDFFAVLVKPDVSISTADAYRAHLPSDQLIPRARQLANRLSGSKPSDIYPYLTNDLEEAAYRVSPEVGELKNQLQRIVSVPVMLSGSGSALFALFDTLDQAMQAAESISNVFGELTYWVIQNNAW